MTDTYKILAPDEIKRRLEPLFLDDGLKLVILFGSTVTGNTHRRSDIDIGLLFHGEIDILALTNRVIRLLKSDRVDVVDLNRANPLLKFSASRNCQVLFEKTPGIFSTFNSLAFRRYVDTKKLRDAQRSVVMDFLHERGLQ
ncbi:MAG: nucleotidyltransferase domain-containing protein [Thermodesulfobacteriota bacterium]